jgi:hypothetical protein
MPLMTRVTPEVVEPSNGLIHLLVASRIASRPHRRFDDRQVVIESIHGEDLVMTGIGHRSVSDFKKPSRGIPAKRDRRFPARYD